MHITTAAFAVVLLVLAFQGCVLRLWPTVGTNHREMSTRANRVPCIMFV